MRIPTSVLVIALCLLTAAGFSQELTARVDENQIGGSRYYVGKEHELLMSVKLLGSVSKPGQYMVPSEMDLVSLIAHAGGFRDDAKLNDIKIVRNRADQAKSKIVRINLEKFYATGDQGQAPRLLPDDTVIIDRRKSVPLKTMADIARGAAYVAQVVYIFFLINKE